MLDDGTNPSTRTELLRLTPSGDLLDLAREMRQMGVESLLFCSPAGRIQQVVTDRQIASLAATPDPVPLATDVPAVDPAGSSSLPDDGGAPVVPRQQVPVRADVGIPVARS